MKNSVRIHLLLNLINAIFILAFNGFNSDLLRESSDFKKIEYKILPSSILEVNGKTNVNSFSCISDETFELEKLDYRKAQNNSSIYFRDTRFNIQINRLDCGKKKINKDLFKALNEKEYPTISIHLKDAINLDCIDANNCGEWQDFEVNTDITITCETRPVKIPILVKKIDQNSYQINGGATLRLCDFNIERPTALLGLIKVKDEIDFNFDLLVDISEV